jgi:hypothetical protein
MGKCKGCGKGGLFYKVNEDGLCNECARIKKLKADEYKLSQTIETQMKNIATLEGEYSSIKDNKERFYSEISEKAKADALSAIENTISEKKNEIMNLENDIGSKKSDVLKLEEEKTKVEKSISLSATKLKKMQTLFKSMQYTTERFFDDENFSKAIVIDPAANEAEEILETTVKLKLNLMDVRELRKLYNQNNKVIQEVLSKYKDRYTTKANAAIYKLMVIALEAELQNILFNMKYSKLDKSISDIKAITAKYQKIATDGNQSIVNTITRFIGEIEYLFIEAIKIEYEYYIQKERIKEEQKAIRDQMRQEAAERKLLEEERKKFEQEEAKYENEIEVISAQITSTKDEIKIKQLEERLAKIQAQLDDVEIKKGEISKLQNGKAGYIYIISNLGSFGESTFKVGMTRRMDPQERVDELGDASVPFQFDVHSFIFSNNAPELENNLHKQLHNKRVNKVNLRKEFFTTSIDELEDLVYSLEPSAVFNKTMLAEQYYQSMAVKEIPESVAIVNDEEEELEEDEA